MESKNTHRPSDPEEAVMGAITRRYGQAGLAAGAPPGPDCLSAETVAALVAGALSPADRAATEAHLADCDRCAAEVGSVMSVAEAGRPAAALTVSLLQKWWVRVAAVVMIGVGMVFLGVGLWVQKRAADERARQRVAEAQFRQELEAALGKAQRVAALYHLSPYKRGTLTPEVAALPFERVRGGPEALPADVRRAGEEAAQEADKALGAIPATGAQQVAVRLAAAQLEAERGRHAQALTLIDQALPQTKGTERTQALILKATVLLDRAQDNDESEGVRILDDLIREMEADRIPMDPDVYYNRATYDQQRGDPGTSTRQLWEHYLRKEPDPRWRKVAEDYLKEIPGARP